MAAPSVPSDAVRPFATRFTARPTDWPASGPIDLGTHDQPHASSTAESWHVGVHCETVDGRKLSLFATFHRELTGVDEETRAPSHVHSISWALHDVDGEQTHRVSAADPAAAAAGLKRIERGLGAADDRLNRALAEIYERGSLPRPDRMLATPSFVSQSRLELSFGDDSFEKLDDGRYRLLLGGPASAFGCELIIEPQKVAVRQGQDGVVRGAADEPAFRYALPRCTVKGTVAVDGRKREVATGQAWYDHEFGAGEVEAIDDAAEARLPEADRRAIQDERRARFATSAVGWETLSAQLEDGTDISICPQTYLASGESAGTWSFISDPSGAASTHKDASVEALESWQSSLTFFTYPVAWRFQVPEAELDLQVRAAYPDQEFITLLSKPSYWEGRVHVEGTLRGQPVRGIGFVQRCGFVSYHDLDGFFEEVGKIVRKSVREVIPLEPTYEAVRDLITTEGREQYMQGVDIDQYARTHLAPIREIVDRGGKGWRSYAAITCCDIVGGDARKYVKWLAMPELMHVGSLIVDDVQDKSHTRRGGKAAHLIYGEAQAINSGTAAYFIVNRVLTAEHLSDASRVRIYELYFDGMRAGHAGQALDLDGFDDLMEEVVSTGDISVLEQRVLAVHRLKTAAPAGCLARMGAVAGGGTDAQIDSLGEFFEALGLAFQIIDDVLNLRGFRGNLKTRAEDVRHGKITLPVVHAMGRLDAEGRRWLHETLRTKPEDDDVVMSVVDKLEELGAVQSCADQAREMVEAAWERLEPLVEDSMAKVLLRSFGWYLLERHY